MSRWWWWWLWCWCFCVQAQPTPMPEARLVQETPGAVVVGEPVTVRYEVWVPTWFLEAVAFPPSLDVDDAVVEMVGGSPESRFQEMGGSRWTGLIRQYRVIPMQPGTLRVGAPPLAVVFGGAGGQRQQATVRVAAPLLVKARIPAGAEALDPFVAAQNLRLTQQWLPQALPSGQVWRVGDVLRREITLQTDSTAPLWPDLAGAREHAGYRAWHTVVQRQVTRVHAAARAQTQQVEQWTYVLEQTGTIVLPAVEWSWWNVQRQRLETTRLPGLELQVHPALSAQDPFAEPQAAPPPRSGVSSWAIFSDWTRERWMPGTARLALVAVAGGGLWWGGRRAVRRLRHGPWARLWLWWRLRWACWRHDGAAADHAAQQILYAYFGSAPDAVWLIPLYAAQWRYLQQARFGRATHGAWSGRLWWRAVKQAVHQCRGTARASSRLPELAP